MAIWKRGGFWLLVAFAALVSVLILLARRVLRLMASDDPAMWAKEIEAFKQYDRQHPPAEGAIVFTGSSSIRFWTTLARDMAPLPVINRGFGGSKMQQVAYYADQIVTPYRPRAVVLFAGTNDLGRFRPKTPQQVLDGYIEFVRTVQAALPEVPIYYIAITPTPLRWKTWPTINETNRLIKAHTENDPHLHFIDMKDQLLGSDGRPRRELYIWDRLHPSAQGYALWTSIIKPVLQAELSRQE